MSEHVERHNRIIVLGLGMGPSRVLCWRALRADVWELMCMQAYECGCYRVAQP